jgi:hypothetical protein
VKTNPKSLTAEPRKRETTDKRKLEPVAQDAARKGQTRAPSYKVHHVALDEIKVVGKRRAVNAEKVQELADSIDAIGLRGRRAAAS